MQFTAQTQALQLGMSKFIVAQCCSEEASYAIYCTFVGGILQFKRDQHIWTMSKNASFSSLLA